MVINCVAVRIVYSFMKIVIPMAGRGSRFKNAGVDTLKPLISVLRKPMVKWTFESLSRTIPDLQPSDYIFVFLEDHEKEHCVSEKIKEILGSNNAKTLFIPEVTEGAACTALIAAKTVNPEEEIAVCDCDQFFVCPQFAFMRTMALQSDWGGLIPTHETTNPGASYAEVGQDGNITQTAEKKLISTHGAIGLYYFTKAKYFADAAEVMIRKNARTKNEFYMCPVYNEVIALGKVVRIVPTELWMTLGTPEDTEYFKTHVPEEYHNSQ